MVMSLSGPVSHRALPGQPFYVPYPRPGSCEFATAAACPGRSGFFTLRDLPQARTELRHRFLSRPCSNLELRMRAPGPKELEGGGTYYRRGPPTRPRLELRPCTRASRRRQGCGQLGPPWRASAAGGAGSRGLRVARSLWVRGRHYRLGSGGPVTNLKAAARVGSPSQARASASHCMAGQAG
jgi:hypothetical protein